ncbi:MAG: 3-phosphoshikimate 1-carboxyvinyltransferase, partial [Lachnospiraceae bacterium]|nr:3-phosphoshikimate 1-carboxyvinyltransferase [Lachnospiraceae bacterium]
LQSLGFEVEVEEQKREVVVRGHGGAIPKRETEIYVGSAGTAARFLTAMLALSDGIYMIQASEQMKKRPMYPLFEALERLGAEFTYLEREGFLPVRVKGSRTGRKEAFIDISKSTQFLSALLMMAPVLGKDFAIHITSEKKDGSYIRITRKMMEQFGVRSDFDGTSYRIKGGQKYRNESYSIEPDVSAACYFYGMAALTGGRVIVRSVHSDSMQGDKKFLNVLKEIGCQVEDTEMGIEVRGSEGGTYAGIEVDMNDFSDQTMTLAALAVFADSKTIIKNIGHIRLQESDRLLAIATELKRMGIVVKEGADYLIIYPGMPKPSVVHTYEDHRMAMAFALIGLKSDGIVIENPMCCKKTFENYFDVLDEIVRRDELVK